MDASTLEALAVAAGNAVVAAAMTDMWDEVRHKIAGVFNRGQRDLRMERRLDSTRSQLAETTAPDLTRVRTEQAARWCGRIADLLTDYPEAEVEVRDLIREIQTLLPATNVTAFGPGAVAIAGDASPTASTGSIAAAVIQGPAIVVNPHRPDPQRR